MNVRRRGMGSPEPTHLLASALLALDVVVGRGRDHKIRKIVAVGLDRAIFTPRCQYVMRVTARHTLVTLARTTELAWCPMRGAGPVPGWHRPPEKSLEDRG
jgi:hypothetical protein